MNATTPFPKRVAFWAEQIEQCGSESVAGLIDLTSDRLVRFATTITRNQHDGEDAVQVVLVRVARSPQCLIEAGQPWGYLLRMVRNESLQILRRRRPMRVITQITDLLTQRRVDELEREDTYRAVWRALRALPVEQSEVIVLKIWESMTLAQIADVLDTPPGTVASRYRAGLQKLAVLLCDEIEEPIHG